MLHYFASKGIPFFFHLDEELGVSRSKLTTVVFGISYQE